MLILLFRENVFRHLREGYDGDEYECSADNLLEIIADEHHVDAGNECDYSICGRDHQQNEPIFHWMPPLIGCGCLVLVVDFSHFFPDEVGDGNYEADAKNHRFKIVTIECGNDPE